MSGRINVYLIAGGKWHDFDFARLELLKLLSEHESLRTKVASDYSDIEGIASSDVLITYTCDVRPTAEQVAAVRRFLARGGRWFALHGTNGFIEPRSDGTADCMVGPAVFIDILGTRFLAHPPICKYQVRVKDVGHPLVDGIKDFEVEDEIYLQDYIDPSENHGILVTEFEGRAEGDHRHLNWERSEHLVMYTRPHSGGELLYLTLGHCRGKYDLQDFVEETPVQRCAWQLPVYYELLRRGIRWTMSAPVLGRRQVDGIWTV